MEIFENHDLKPLTTFSIGGKAAYFTEVFNKKDLIKAVEFAEKKKLPIFVIGHGSNLLVDDHLLNALVIKLTNKDFSISQKGDNNFLVLAGAGMDWDSLVEKTVKNNLQGLECLSGIPGTVGAAPVQNIGAYGQEVKDCLEKVFAYDLIKGKFIEIDNHDCHFEYRNSIFKEQKNRYIIFEVIFRLKRNTPASVGYESLSKHLQEKGITQPQLEQVRKAVLELRKVKLEDPKLFGNAGSFFKNPIVDKISLKRIQKLYPEIPFFKQGDKVKLFAGWLIEKAGWRGRNYHSAAVSGKNAMVIINSNGRAKSSDVLALATMITRDVEEKFGIKLKKEVEFVGEC